jgi:hypothetical protein
LIPLDYQKNLKFQILRHRLSQKWWHRTVILATKEVEIRTSWFEINLSKNLVRPHLNQQTGHGAVHPSYMGGIGRKITIEDQL